jgi:hypothetical protein
MIKIEAKATVTKEGKLMLSTPVDVPPEVSPGEHIVQLTINGSESFEENKPLDIPLIHIDSWPENLSLRREDMYDDWGR